MLHVEALYPAYTYVPCTLQTAGEYVYLIYGSKNQGLEVKSIMLVMKTKEDVFIALEKPDMKPVFEGFRITIFQQSLHHFDSINADQPAKVVESPQTAIV